jgi:hypothetical protein
MEIQDWQRSMGVKLGQGLELKEEEQLKKERLKNSALGGSHAGDTKDECMAGARDSDFAAELGGE